MTRKQTVPIEQRSEHLKWYYANRSTVLVKNALWRAENKDRLDANLKRDKLANPQKYIDRNRATFEKTMADPVRKAKYRAYQEQYYADHKDELETKSEQYRLDHLAYYAAYQRNYRAEHRDQMRLYINEYMRNYRASPRGKVIFARAQARSKMKQGNAYTNFINSCTPEEFAAFKQRQNKRQREWYKNRTVKQVAIMKQKAKLRYVVEREGPCHLSAERQEQSYRLNEIYGEVFRAVERKNETSLITTGKPLCSFCVPDKMYKPEMQLPVVYCLLTGAVEITRNSSNK